MRFAATATASLARRLTSCNHSALDVSTLCCFFFFLPPPLQMSNIATILFPVLGRRVRKLRVPETDSATSRPNEDSRSAERWTPWSLPESQGTALKLFGFSPAKQVRGLRSRSWQQLFLRRSRERHAAEVRPPYASCWSRF